MAKGTQYSKQFKEDAVRYRKDHPELTVQKAAENLGISESALKNWMKAARENEGSVPTRGTGNYSSDEAKEIARLKRELRDTKDALEILKKQSVSWENNRSYLYCHFRIHHRGGRTATETPGFC
ncbi:MAG: transposase [Lachnospiraceae bacterium]